MPPPPQVPIQEIQAVKQQHEKRVSLALSVLSDSETWNFNTSDPNNLQLHDYSDNNDNNDEFNTSLNHNNDDFNASQHSLNINNLQQQQQQQQHDDLNLRADYDAAIKCIHLCESIITTLQHENSQHDQTIRNLQLQTSQLMHSLQMAEMEQGEELARVRRERDECEERLVEMSLELARAKSLEDEYYLVRRRLTLTNDDDGDGGGEAFFQAEKVQKVDCSSTVSSSSSSKQETLRTNPMTMTATKALEHEHRRPSHIAQEAADLRLSYLALPKKNNSNDDEEEEGGIPIDLRSSYLGMGFGWPQDHVKVNVNVDSNAIDGDCDSDVRDGSQAVVSIEPYSSSTRRVSSSSLVSVPQEDEGEGATPTTQTESTTIECGCSSPTDKMIIDGDEKCTSSDNTANNVKDKNKPGPPQQPSISSSLWNQVETFTKTAARRSKLSSAAESALLFGRSGNTTTKDAHPHNKDSLAFGFGWPEKENNNNNKDHNDDDKDGDGCLSVSAPTVPSTALSSSSITSACWDQGITTYNTDSSSIAAAIRSSSNHSSSIVGRMASNITSSSGTSFVKSVVGDFLVNLKEETVRV